MFRITISKFYRTHKGFYSTFCSTWGEVRGYLIGSWSVVERIILLLGQNVSVERAVLCRTFEGDVDKSAVPTPCWVFDTLFAAGFDDAVDAAALAFKEG